MLGLLTCLCFLDLKLIILSKMEFLFHPLMTFFNQIFFHSFYQVSWLCNTSFLDSCLLTGSVLAYENIPCASHTPPPPPFLFFKLILTVLAITCPLSLVLLLTRLAISYLELQSGSLLYVFALFMLMSMQSFNYVTFSFTVMVV